VFHPGLNVSPPLDRPSLSSYDAISHFRSLASHQGSRSFVSGQDRLTMKHEPAVRHHTPDDPPATVIHHYEQDQTLLARWIQRLLAQGATFWFLVAGSAAVVLLVGYLLNNLMSGPSTTSRAWTEVMMAGSAEDFQRVAETESETSAGRWAALRAATSRYADALKMLPVDRETAAPLLKQALEGFEAIEKDPQADPMLQRLAILGSARTLETQDSLPEAIAEYEKIAKQWPDTDDGKAAAKRAIRLKTPEAIAFYKKFATYKAKFGTTTLPPRGKNIIDLPTGHPSLDGPTMDAPPLTGGVPAGSIGSGKELPNDPFQKTGTERKVDSKDELLPPVFPDEKEKAPTKAPSPPK
jgi:hypothetical protein